jgi:hypothetical protein
MLHQLGAVEPENMWGSHPPEQSTGQLNTYLNNGSPVLGIGREPGHIRRCQSVMPLLLGIPLAGCGQG